MTSPRQTHITYANFDLLITATSTAYTARVLNSPLGEATTSFALPFTEQELSRFDWLAPHIRRDVIVLSSATGRKVATLPLTPQSFGVRLYDAVFAGSVGIQLLLSLDAAQRNQQGLRIRLRFDEQAIALSMMPWEYLYATPLKRFVVLSDQTIIVRYIELFQAQKPLQIVPPLRILALISMPTDERPLQVETEWQRLQQTLKPLVDKQLVVLERLAIATVEGLQARLRGDDIHILHYIGHGYFDGGTNHGGLILEDEQRGSRPVAADRLATLLHDHQALRLVFLNACEGARTGHSDFFAGTAQTLVQQAMPAVVAMQFKVSDPAAIALAREFYAAMVSGYPVDAALTEARKALYAEGNDLEWSTPALFSRAADNQLFDLLDILPPSPCPYPGMVPFTKADVRFFFGREDEIAELRRRLRHQNQLFVIGPSGSGKSSLVFAGLLPALEKQDSELWCIRTFRPGATPLAALDEALTDERHSAQASTEVEARNDKLLLVVDQLEELFVQANKADQIAFIARLKTLRQDQQVKLLITMRADFYPDLMNSDLWPIDLSQRLEITPLRGEQLRYAIERPAARVGVQLEAGLIERLLADAADAPGVLPLLQETMVLLWEKQARHVLPLAAYTRLGKDGRNGLAVAMATKADATLASLAPKQQSIARRIFLRLVQFGEGRPDTRRQQALIDLRSVTGDIDLFDATLQLLADHRLLTLTGDAHEAARKVDIAHEMLLISWPAVQAWVQARRDAELTRRRLEVKAVEWVRLGRASGGVLDVDELNEAERWLAGSDAEELGYSEALQSLVQQSRITVDTALAEKVEQQKALAAETVRAEEQSKISSRLRRFSFALAAFAVLAVLAGSLAWMQRQAATVSEAKARSAQQETERLSKIIRADQLAQKASLAHVDTTLQRLPQLALLLAIEASDVVSPPIPSALTTLYELLRRTSGTGLGNSEKIVEPYNNSIKAVTFSLDGQMLASAGVDKTIQVQWIGKLDAEPQILRGHESTVLTLAFAPDGRTLASGSYDGTIRLWQLDSLEAEPTILRHEGGVKSVIFAPDGNMLASGGDDGTVRIWSMNNVQAEPLILRGHARSVYSLVFAPTGSTLASGSADGTIRLWQVSNFSSEPIVLQVDEEGLISLAFSPDGQILASGGFDNLVRLWQMDHLNAEPLILGGHESWIHSLAFTSNGMTLASGSNDGTIRLWRLDNLTLEPIILRGHERGVNSMMFAPDGNMLASGGDDGMVRVWSMDRSMDRSMSVPLVLQDYEDAVRAVVFAPNQRTLANGTMDGAVYIWHLDVPKLAPIVLRGHEGAIHSLAYSPDGQVLASGSADKTVRLWRLNDANSSSVILQGHTDAVNALAFSLDGRLLASGSSDGTVVLWRLDSLKANSVILHVGDGPVRSVAFAPNGKVLAVGSQDGPVRLWQVDSLETTPSVLPGPDGWIFSVAFSPDGKMIAVGSISQVQLWQLDDLKGEPAVLAGHGAVVHSIAFSPDSKTLVSAADTSVVWLWRINDVSIEPVNLNGRGFSTAVYSIAFSSDGETVASGSANGKIQLWPVNVIKLRHLACTTAGRNFSQKEWMQYFPNEPYRHTC